MVSFSAARKRPTTRQLAFLQRDLFEKNGLAPFSALSYIANDLQIRNRLFNPLSKAAVATLLAGMVLLLDAMAACPALHELLHHDCDDHEHHCAVTMFAHGKVDSVAVEISPAAATVLIQAEPQIEFLVFAPAIKDLPPGRAPPFCSVS
ncbi:MAG TPA: hypothetical protein VFV23_13675 [Verrucomicrobiae bacterium]|nr:hypothetical protein [Verrucomicrobiae bacterium]